MFSRILKVTSRTTSLTLCCHQMRHSSRYLPFVRGIHRSPVNFPHKGQWRGALVFSLIFVWIIGWVNNREAGNLRRYRAYYDVSVITLSWSIICIDWYTPNDYSYFKHIYSNINLAFRALAGEISAPLKNRSLNGTYLTIPSNHIMFCTSLSSRRKLIVYHSSTFQFKSINKTFHPGLFSDIRVLTHSNLVTFSALLALCERYPPITGGYL